MQKKPLIMLLIILKARSELLNKFVIKYISQCRGDWLLNLLFKDLNVLKSVDKFLYIFVDACFVFSRLIKLIRFFTRVTKWNFSQRK